MKTKLFALFAAVIFSSTFLGMAIETKPANTGESVRIAEMASMYKGIVKLHIKLGQKVKKGDLLFELDSKLMDIKLKGAEKNLKINKDIYEGGAKLAKSHAISIQDYQWVYHDYITTQEDYQIIQDTIKNSKYYAPFDGTVTGILRYDGSGLGDNDTEVILTEGDVLLENTRNIVMVCNRWAGIIDLKVKAGQDVKKGDILFTTSSNILKSQLKSDSDRLARTKEIYERQLKLTETHSSSFLELLKAESEYNKAVADVEIDKTMIEQTTYFAPFDGKITKIFRYSNSGNGEGKPVVELTEQ